MLILIIITIIIVINTFLWLSVGDLRAEICVISAQYQALQTKHHAIKILHTEAESKCRLCQNFDETINQITSQFPVQVIEQYIKRYDAVCAQLHCNMCKEMGVQLDKEHWHEDVPNR